MDTKTMNRKSGPKFGTKMALLASAAVMSVTFTASAASAAPRADVSYSKAQKALAKGKTAKAIDYAEAAVMADPRNATYRALLAKTYLEAGRYNSAATSYDDAMKLGDTDPSTVLGYALTQTAIGGGKNALDTLMKFERSMDPADLGLAIALAGNPERGVFVLTNALRSGQNSAKVRQNLAYTYALAGNWRGARVMAAEDVPADQLDARLSQWASSAKPEDHMIRVANLLGIASSNDGGMPTALALANFPSPQEVMAASTPKKAPTQVAKAPARPSPAKPVKVAAAAPKPVVKPMVKPAAKPIVKPAPAPVKTVATAPAPRAAQTRTPVVASTKPSAKAMEGVVAKPVSKPAQNTVVAQKSPSTKKPSTKNWGASKTPRSSAKSAPASSPTFTFVSRPVTQKLAVSSAAPQRVAAVVQKALVPAPKRAAKPVSKPAPTGDSHMIQLGSYNSEAEAKGGWANLARKYGDLAAHDVVITKAEVKGKTYFRLAAAGFGRQGAAQMCSTVRSSGGGCFAYAKINPPKGAVGQGVRIASAKR